MARSAADLKSSYDVVIVGARCAGAATAMQLARSGMDVLLIEQGLRGADTLSTLALMRGGVLQLARWGLLDAVRAAGTPPIRTTTFHYDDEAIEIRIKPRDGVDALYAPRRTVLDPLIADAAAAAGADVAYGVRLSDVVRDEHGRLRGVLVEGRDRVLRRVASSLVVGADGVHSTVARRVGAEPYRLGPHTSAVIYTFVPGLDVQGYHWHYVPGASVGVIPTTDAVLVFVAVTRERFMRELRFDLERSFRSVLETSAPPLAAQVRAAGGGRTYRGFAGQPGFLRQAWGPGWALVGDAGYFKDPLTAHGITDALRDSTLLARAALDGTDTALAAYQAVRDDLSVRLFEITDAIASFDWDMPSLQRLHKEMSDEMGREVLYLRDLGLAETVGTGQ